MGRCPGQTGTVSGTNGTPPWDKLGPVPGTNRLFSVEFHSKISILSRLSPGRVGVRPRDDCPARAVRKMLMCLVFLGFFLSPPENHFSQIFVLVRLQVLLLKIFHQEMKKTLGQQSIELAIVPACASSLSALCTLSKSSEALQRVLAVPAWLPWQGKVHEEDSDRAHAKGVVLCERTCFCLLSTF